MAGNLQASVKAQVSVQGGMGVISSLVCWKGAWVGAVAELPVENAASSSPASGALHPHLDLLL